MNFLLFLVVASLVSVAAALILPGWSDLLLVAAPCALASIFLLLREWARRSKSSQDSASNFVVVDGSNVMHWKDGTPQIDTVREVVRHLSTLGFTPGVVFDANAGYLLSGKYQHDGELRKVLGLPKDRVMVVPKGTPADPTILTAARKLNALIVTNDRFRDWTDKHPEVCDPGYLIRGGYRSGSLWLDLGSNEE